MVLWVGVERVGRQMEKRGVVGGEMLITSCSCAILIAIILLIFNSAVTVFYTLPKTAHL